MKASARFALHDVEDALLILERTFEGLSAPDLKSIIVDAALAGYYTTHDAEDLISFYGLRHV